MYLQVYHYEQHTQVLGYGQRFALWVQGCNFHCNGCLVPDSWPLKGGTTYSVRTLADKIQNTQNIQGITLTGGEPFLQASSLVDLLSKLDDSLDVIAYTGFRYEEICADPEKCELLAHIDLLIDGRFEAEKNRNEPLVGSENQNIYILTSRGQYLAEFMQKQTKREIEINIHGDQVFTVGVPPKNGV